MTPENRHPSAPKTKFTKVYPLAMTNIAIEHDQVWRFSIISVSKRLPEGSFHCQLAADFCHMSDLAAQTVFDTDLSLAPHARCAGLQHLTPAPHRGPVAEGGRRHWPKRPGEVSNRGRVLLKICVAACRLSDFMPQIMRCTAKLKLSNLQIAERSKQYLVTL